MANLSLKFGLKLIDDITPNVKPGFEATISDCNESSAN